MPAQNAIMLARSFKTDTRIIRSLLVTQLLYTVGLKRKTGYTKYNISGQMLFAAYNPVISGPLSRLKRRFNSSTLTSLAGYKHNSTKQCTYACQLEHTSTQTLIVVLRIFIIMFLAYTVSATSQYAWRLTQVWCVKQGAKYGYIME
jgi:hypothetical protein